MVYWPELALNPLNQINNLCSELQSNHCQSSFSVEIIFDVVFSVEFDVVERSTCSYIATREVFFFTKSWATKTWEPNVMLFKVVIAALSI